MVMVLKFHRFRGGLGANSKGITHEPGDDQVPGNGQGGFDSNRN
jgi:hypothetical protein